MGSGIAHDGEPLASVLVCVASPPFYLGGMQMRMRLNSRGWLVTLAAICATCAVFFGFCILDIHRYGDVNVGNPLLHWSSTLACLSAGILPFALMAFLRWKGRTTAVFTGFLLVHLVQRCPGFGVKRLPCSCLRWRSCPSTASNATRPCAAVVRPGMGSDPPVNRHIDES